MELWIHIHQNFLSDSIISIYGSLQRWLYALVLKISICLVLVDDV